MTNLFKKKASQAANKNPDAKQSSGEIVTTQGGALRIDSAHTTANEDSEAFAGLVNDEALPEHVRRHLQQLQAKLRSQQEALDERESQLNAHIAQLDAELRRARFLESQVQADQDGDTTQQDLKQRLDQKQRDLRIRELKVQAGEIRLQEEREALQQQAQSTTGKNSLGKEGQHKRSPSDSEALARQASLMETWEQELADAETKLTNELAAARVARERAESISQSKTNSLQLEQLAWQERRDTTAAQIAECQRQLDAREAELNQKSTAIQQMQEEVSRLHRDALENRLATEELRVQLDEDLGHAQTARHLKQLRKQIRDDYRAEQQQIAAQLESLEETATELAENHRRLQKESERLNNQAREQSAAMAREHEELSSRRTQLDSDTLAHAVAQGRWQQERHEYESEIRRLKAEIRRVVREEPAK